MPVVASEQLVAVVAEFAGARVELADPAVALGRCGEVDQAFRAFAGSRLPAVCWRRVFAVGPVAMSPSRAAAFAAEGWALSGIGHNASVVLTGGGWTVVDLTYSQFDGDASWPLVEPLCRYGRRFSRGLVWDVWDPVAGRRLVLR